MGSRELIESLHTEAERELMKIREEARARMEKIRVEGEEKLREKQKKYDAMLEEASKKETGLLLKSAKDRAREAKLSAETSLSGRLYRTALLTVKKLRNKNYGEVFRRLAQELPPADWESIIVNPLDEELARSLFPNAQVIPDSEITGGMEAEAAEGAIRVINTFEKRLERLWPMLLPELMADTYREIK
jgi:V/A-type H+-transporting ATPase subunit E